MKKILFNDRFVLTKAVLIGRKTMTRRLVPEGTPCGCWSETVKCSRYQVGEVVAIAQSYRDVAQGGYLVDARYDAFRTKNWGEGEDGTLKGSAGWNNKLFVRADLMPHHIRTIDIKMERLQDISDEDCIKEGIYPYYYGDEKEKIECGFYPDGFSFDGIDCHYPTPREAYAVFIDLISGKGTWDSNPWVFCYEFEIVD